MARLSIAFILALVFHLLLSAFPLSQQKHTLPQPVGNKAITVNLAQAETSTPTSQQQQVRTSKPAKRAVPETKDPAVPTATPREPIEKIRQLAVAKKFKSPAKRTAHPIKTGQAISSSPSETASTAAIAPIKARPTSQGARAVTESAIIKARPLYDQSPKPLYPPLARKRGWQGVVVLAVMVLQDGSPAQLSVHKSCGHDLLDKTALAAVQRWHFLPGTKNNIPTSMEVLVPVHFKLQ